MVAHDDTLRGKGTVRPTRACDYAALRAQDGKQPRHFERLLTSTFGNPELTLVAEFQLLWIPTTTAQLPNTSSMPTPTATSSTSPTTDVTKDNFILIFTNKTEHYKEWRQCIQLYYRKMTLLNKKKEAPSIC